MRRRLSPWPARAAALSSPPIWQDAAPTLDSARAWSGWAASMCWRRSATNPAGWTGSFLGGRGDFQSTYQVLVARSPEKLSLGQGDLWGQCLPEANSINAGCLQQDEHTFFARLCARFDSVCSKVPWWGEPGFVLVDVTATI